MPDLKLILLGGLRILGPDGVAVPLPPKKARALLAYLALQPDQPFSRSRLSRMLWGAREAPHPRKSLRQALVALRRLASSAQPLIACDAETLRMPATSCETDVAEFERLTARDDREALARAVDLYHGPLLDGLDIEAPEFEAWLSSERERLHQQALGAAQTLLERAFVAGPTGEAIARALQVLELDPLCEPAHRRLMELYARQNRRGAALRQYRTCRSVLKREHGLNPTLETERLQRRIRGHAEAAIGAQAAGHGYPAQAATAQAQRRAANPDAPRLPRVTAQPARPPARPGAPAGSPAADPAPDPLMGLAQIQLRRLHVFFPGAEPNGSPEVPTGRAAAAIRLADAHYLCGRVMHAHEQFERAVTLCREAGLASLETAATAMRALTGLYRNHVDAALRDALAAARSRRDDDECAGIDLLVCDIASEVLVHAGAPADAEAQARAGLACARRIEARDTEPVASRGLARALLAQARRAEALELLTEAYPRTLTSGSLCPPESALGLMAEASEDHELRDWALAEGEARIVAGHPAQGALDFYRAAIDLAIADGDGAAVRRWAAALEGYTGCEPLPWTHFLVARARAIAACLDGPPSPPVRDALRRLKRQAERNGLHCAVPALDAALHR